jgi:hypothetical protein
MALEEGINSFVSLIDAEEYFQNRLDAAAWVAASTLLKEQALVTATMILDNMSWTGTAIDDHQSLAFPRAGLYYDPKLGKYKFLEDHDVPVRIKVGTFELAHHLLNNDGLLDDTGTVTNLNVGQIALNIKNYPQRIPSIVRNHISPLLEQQGRRVWWRAN